MGISRLHSVGIDEVGRGPIAGPVTVAGVIAYTPGIRKKLLGIRDSKKLSEKQREEWFEKLTDLKSKGDIEWKIGFATSETIDKKGIAKSVRRVVHRVVHRLVSDPTSCRVLLDGGLYAPSVFVHQKTIIRGDEKEPLIAAASIIAKVHRDKRMRQYAKQFPEYGFERHKGYGTEKHLKAVRKYGLCSIHRETFIY